MTTKGKASKLTPKQERFVQEYLIDLNATQAAIRAGYSADTAKQQGSRLLTNVDVASAIASKQGKLADKYEVTAERVVRELALIGFANMLDYVTIGQDGLARVDLSAVNRDQAAAIHEIRVDSVIGNGEDAKVTEKVTFKLADKRAALVDLGKHLNLFREQVDINVHHENALDALEQAINDQANSARRTAH